MLSHQRGFVKRSSLSQFSLRNGRPCDDFFQDSIVSPSHIGMQSCGQISEAAVGIFAETLFRCIKDRPEQLAILCHKQIILTGSHSIRKYLCRNWTSIADIIKGPDRLSIFPIGAYKQEYLI